MSVGERAPLSRWPWLAATLTLAAALAYAFPDLTPWLAFNREASLAGQWWRLVSGHFCHFNRSHFVGDVAAFFVWAAVVESLSRRCLILALLGTFTFVALWLLGSSSAPLDYRGLSAVDCALAAALMTLGSLDARVRSNRWLLGGLIAAAVLFIAKSCFEVAMGHAVLAPQLGEHVRLVPQAHGFGILAGVLSGAVEGMWRRALERRRRVRAYRAAWAEMRIGSPGLES